MFSSLDIRENPLFVKMKNCRNGTFEPVHEIQNFFWPKAFFWSIMKIATKKFFITCPRVCQIQDLCRKKYKKGIFSDVQWWKNFFTHFSDSTHQECMIFARIGHGPCYKHCNEIYAGVRERWHYFLLFGQILDQRPRFIFQVSIVP